MELDEMSRLDPEGVARSQTQMQQMGQLKLEILKLKNRIGVIKAFYSHFRAAETSVVRREVRDKIDNDSDLITASVTVLTDAITRWEAESKITEVRENLRDVLAEYHEVLADHRQITLDKLRTLLKVAHRTEDPRSKTFLIEKGELTSLNEAQHIEIEELYAQLLRTDFILRNLNSRYSAWLTVQEHTDLALLDISRVMEMAQQENLGPRQSLRFTTRIKVTLLALLFTIAFAVFVYLMLTYAAG